jgi:ribosome-associated translation inhibitor RaiA
MQTALHITLRHLPSTPALEAQITDSVRHLERLHHNIISCRVVVEATQRDGAPFIIRIDLNVPGRTLCVDTARSPQPAHSNAYVALHDAFATLEQQLLTYDKQRQTNRRRAVPARQLQDVDATGE